MRRLLRTALAREAPSPLLVASANLQKVHRFGRGGGGEGFFEHSPLSDHWVVLLDGAPLAAQARRVTGSDWPRLAGADLLPHLLEMAAEAGVRTGFLGGDRATHDRVRALAASRWPELEISGVWSPSPEEVDRDSRALAHQVRRSGAGLLVVALTPRSEQWLDRWSTDCDIVVGAAFGAAADFLAGERRRAPRPVQRAGLEWAWRLAHEPQRLARRYLWEGPPAYWRLRRHSSAAQPRP